MILFNLIPDTGSKVQDFLSFVLFMFILIFILSESVRCHCHSYSHYYCCCLSNHLFFFTNFSLSLSLSPSPSPSLFLSAIKSQLLPHIPSSLPLQALTAGKYLNVVRGCVGELERNKSGLNSGRSKWME